MKAVSLVLILVGLFALAPQSAFSQTPAAPAPTPTVEQRLSALEAYIANTDPNAAIKATNPAGAPLPVLPTAGLPGPAHNGWMMTCTVLVLFMTLPGLALSYGGLVRRKNVLSILAQCLGIAGMVTILWWAVGYSLAFAPGKPWLGGLTYAFLHHVGPEPNPDYSYWVSHNVFASFELMFAIITPALIIGATAERMRFAAVLVFTFVWMFLVFIPVEHMMWGVDGMMNGVANPHALIKAVDSAGGIVVHMTCGWSSLVICMMLGKRKGFGKEKMPPHSIVLCMVGTMMLWVGWYGFNTGSALGVDAIASNIFLNTTLSAAVGAAAWGFAEWIGSHKSSTLGFCSGAIGGLVIIAPACAYVSSTSAVILGVLGGILPYFAVVKMKMWLGYDDALDAFGVHAINGTIGILLTGFLARADVNPRLNAHLGSYVGHTLWVEQVKAIFIVLVISVVGSFIAGCIAQLVVGLRPTLENESLGLDLTEHGEEGYIL
jgi:ammonium transporter, Amt family